jgi:putative ABC transport system permease protein
LFILGIAWVNYINLATARSVERAKEVGVRKVMGAQRGALIQQFLAESLILNVMSLFVSAAFFIAAVKAFDTFSGKPDLSFHTMTLNYWLLFGGLFIVGAFLSGLYPAFMLSGFQPVTVLKGLFKNSTNGVLLRKSLIVTQFVTSVVLITGTIMVYRQLQYMRGFNLGAEIGQTLVIEGASTMIDSIYNDLYQPFKTTLLSNTNIKYVTSSSSVMGKEIYWTSGVKRLDQPEATGHTMYDFIPAYQIKMVSGRNFSKDYSKDNKGVLLTEAGAKELGFINMEETVGKKLLRRDTLTILGIAASYHHQGLQKSLDPTIILLRPNIRTYYSVKLNDSNPAKALAQIQATWNRYFPADPFNYFFLDESYNQQYKGEILFGKVFGIFSLLGIVIACFGLLGLSAYNVIQRTKEIGIRKVIGASEMVILRLLTFDFVKLICIALLIAIPLSWMIMNKWLSGFAFRTTMEWWIFLGAGGIALFIAFATISIQAFKSIKSKPVTSLRTE